MEPTPTLARRLWEAIEPIHSVVYFAPEPTDAVRALGLRGFWQGYFAGRLAPIGPLRPGAATSMLFGFAPTMVARAIPDAWSYATPEAIVTARLGAVAAAMRRTLPSLATKEAEELCGLLATGAAACRCDGRPVAGGWSSVAAPDDPVARLWLLTTILREHRGDGHVAAAVALRLRGIDAPLTHVATRAITRQLMQPTRGWTDDDWEQSRRRLSARGLIDRDGRLTKTGGALRKELEDATDRLAAAPVEPLGTTGVERIIALAAPLSRRLVDDGVIPVPNPIGAPRP
ncbi:MAG: SCO6745 family protein [Acidimicrobiia bacterium]